MRTVLIDYGSGNLRSAAKALEAAGLDVRVSNDPREGAEADTLVLPGQGHFRQVMEGFRQSGFEDVVREHVAAGKPFLGICVGMQILFESSEEAPGVPGLAMIPGIVRRFPRGELAVPQMQWNLLRPAGDSPLMRGLQEDAYAYFVHSYYAEPHAAAVGAVSNYGVDFLSVVSRDNVQATQFHPEKSQAVGLRLLANFREWAQAS